MKENGSMPNDVANMRWTELPVTLAPEPTVCMGLLSLANDGTLESDVHDFLRAPDIRICTTRVYTPLRNTLATLGALRDRIADAASALVPEDRLDVVGFGCTSGAMALGPETIRTLLTRDRPGLLATDPVSSALRALARLGCGRIALLTPYIGEVNAMVEQYLTKHGLELCSTGYFPLSDDNARARVTATSFLDAAKQLSDQPGVEALFISCTALRTFGLVEQIEERIGRPVVTSNQALSWNSLRLTGDTRVVANAGRLFQLN
jgi:maleate isomerase